MKTDKDTIIGITLITILFIAYFYVSSKQKDEFEKQQAKNTATQKLKEKAKPQVGLNNVHSSDSEILTTVENNVSKIVFSSKGGMIKTVELKNYKDYKGKQVTLNESPENFLAYQLPGTQGNNENSLQKNFVEQPTVKNSDGSFVITYLLKIDSLQSISHNFKIRPNDYTIDWDIEVDGAKKLFPDGYLKLERGWQTSQLERSAKYEKQMSNVCFYENKQFDYISQKNTHTFETPFQWVGMVQQFFNSTIIGKQDFESGVVNWKKEPDSSHFLADADCQMMTKLPNGNKVSVGYQLYNGPNDYKILNSKLGMDQIVNLGRDIYAFVRPINQFIIMPVFNFLSTIVSNIGWAILLLTLFIRICTSPLLYSSYLSGAKMKVLKPELDAFKKKHGDNQQAFALDQMKLFREAGVNPAAGCIPALLQVPIFFALYSFFNSNIALRGQSFLWAKDLSSYDSIYTLPFSIPFDFGDHISLFTLTAVLTSFAISLYNMGNTQMQDNPSMKYMPYIFPFMMLFFFNRLPAALTWYYTISNSITLTLQFVIQHYIIDHNKILAKMEEERKKPKTKPMNKWQERYQQMLETQNNQGNINKK